MLLYLRELFPLKKLTLRELTAKLVMFIHVNLYGMSVSFTDFHPFKLLTGVHLKSYGL